MVAYKKGTLESLLNKNTSAVEDKIENVLHCSVQFIKPIKQDNLISSKTQQDTLKPPKKVRDDTENLRTAFVGNVPLEFSQSQLCKQLNLQPNSFESMRFRSIPVISKLSKQRFYGVRTKQFTGNCDTKNAYVVFRSQSDCEAFTKKHIVKLESGKSLRISKVNTTDEFSKFDKDRSIFVGNLNTKTTEDDLKNLCEANVAKVSNVRIIRDKKTYASKNFGFVEFNSAHFLPKALRKLNGIVLDTRPLNVTRTLSKEQAKKQDKRRHDYAAKKMQKKRISSNKEKIKRIREKLKKRRENRLSKSTHQ